MIISSRQADEIATVKVISSGRQRMIAMYIYIYMYM